MSRFNNAASLPLIGALLLTVLLVILVGRLLHIASVASTSEISVREDTRASVHVERAPRASREKVIDVTVPPGMRFVASRNGKKYYEIGSKMAERLMPRNRMYFKNAEEAERAGYLRN